VIEKIRSLIKRWLGIFDLEEKVAHINGWMIGTDKRIKRLEDLAGRSILTGNFGYMEGSWVVLLSINQTRASVLTVRNVPGCDEQDFINVIKEFTDKMPIDEVHITASCGNEFTCFANRKWRTQIFPR